VDFEVVRYLDDPLSVEELDRLCRQVGVEPLEIVRTGDKYFKELGLTSADPRRRQEWREILAQNPRFMQRPIAISGERAVVGRPPAAVLELL
jgi:arsenate reductase